MTELVEHPSFFIQEEIEERGWTVELLSRKMTDNASENQKNTVAINRLMLDLYMIVGPDKTSMMMGDTLAGRLGFAFKVSPSYFLGLHALWIESKKKDRG